MHDASVANMFLLSYVVGCVFTTLLSVFAIYRWKHKYWERKGLPSIKPSFPFGSTENIFRRTEPTGVLLKKQLDSIKHLGHKHVGYYYFTQPVYIPTDPEYVKNILCKDFQHFTDRGLYYDTNKDLLSNHLFTLNGRAWKTMRAKLTPTFTISKIKTMFEIVQACSSQLSETIGNFHGESVDIKQVLECFTTDVIGSCAFGIECRSFVDKESTFAKMGRNVFAPNKFRALIMLFYTFYPNLHKIVSCPVYYQEEARYFYGITEETVKYRKKNNFSRKDFLQILMELLESSDPESRLNMIEVAAQAYVFFLAGFETSSSAMAFCLHELSLNQDIQERVRMEISEVQTKHGEKLTYEALNEMKYLGQVIDETLRMHPPGHITTRRCVKDYAVPDTNVVIDEGTFVMIPIYYIHYDPSNYPDPKKFDPERFNEKNRDSIKRYSYLPFGEGNRNCIGGRFAYMQMKCALAQLLTNHKFLKCATTKTPLEYDAHAFTLTTKAPIKLLIEKISVK